LVNAFVIGSTVVGTLGILAWRVREGQAPVRLGKIIAPPLGMSTGFAMFFSERTQVPCPWTGVAFLFRAFILASPLILTSRLHQEPDGRIWMKRSPIFFFMLLALVTIRFGLRNYLEQYITFWQTGSLAFILAFGMILQWRLRMLRDFKKLSAESADNPALPQST